MGTVYRFDAINGENFTISATALDDSASARSYPELPLAVWWVFDDAGAMTAFLDQFDPPLADAMEREIADATPAPEWVRVG